MKSDYFELYPEKFLSSLDVQMMSCLEFGAYCKILFASWIQDKPCFILNDPAMLARLCGMTEQEWGKVSQNVLKKFTQDGMYLYNEMLYSVWKNQNRGKRSKTSEEYIKSAATLNYTWEQFWHDYDKKVGSPERLVPKWLKLTDAERNKIREYIPKYKAAKPEKQFRLNPETFLNQKGWNNEIIQSKTLKPQKNLGSYEQQTEVKA